MGINGNKIAELVARNLVAWDTSKDKREGLLPEVYVKNLYWYKRLTGEEYSFPKACEKFNIGERRMGGWRSVKHE